MLSIWLLCVVSLNVIIYYVVKNRKELRYWRKLSKYVHKLPAPPSVNFFLGNVPALYDTPDEVFKVLRQWGSKYYPIYNSWIGAIPAANILAPEDFELILSNTKHITKSAVYQLLHSWLGTGLLTSNDIKWHTRRKILTPAFHFNILRQFIAIFNEETDTLVNVLKTECHKPFINVNTHITQFALKTIAETAMGAKLNFNTKKEQEYKKAIFEISELFIYRLLRPWLILPWISFFTPSRHFTEKRLLKTLHTFTSGVILERERDFKGIPLTLSECDEDWSYSTKKRLAMLDLLLSVKNEENGIDDEGIREEVDTFMFEGHDTTAMALCFALMVLACHDDVQNKIVAEIQEVLGSISKKPSYNDLQELKYMERCIKEILRIYPSVPFISRALGEDLITDSGYKLLKHTLVHMHIYDLHHNSKLYPDPEKFDPDRFSPENCQKRHPFAYLPFSAGPRNCIGQRFAILEMKAVLCGILTNFILEPVDTPKTIVLTIDIVLRTKDGIKVKFVPRT